MISMANRSPALRTMVVQATVHHLVTHMYMGTMPDDELNEQFDKAEEIIQEIRESENGDVGDSSAVDSEE